MNHTTDNKYGRYNTIGTNCVYFFFKVVRKIRLYILYCIVTAVILNKPKRLIVINGITAIKNIPTVVLSLNFWSTTTTRVQIQRLLSSLKFYNCQVKIMCFIPYNNYNLDKIISLVLIFMLVIFNILFVVIKNMLMTQKGQLEILLYIDTCTYSDWEVIFVRIDK